MGKTRIKEWPESERPREKLFRHGEHTLSNAELLAILFGSGSRGISALDLGIDIVTHFKTFRNMSHADIRELGEFKGMADVKIARLKAVFEIARRFMSEKSQPKRLINSPKEAAELFMPRLRDLKKEIFKILLLDSKNNIINIFEIEEGTVDCATPQIREIVVKALQNFAVSIIAVHNHPSGDPAPSEEDIEFTENLKKAGEAVQLNILDHIIIGDNRFYSFADNKCL
jgi:DNA repair protein RadC